MVNEQARSRKYLSKRLITGNTGIVISRWASDMDTLKKIANQQKQSINPDAIFGMIDPRDTGTVKLKEMFEAKKPSQLRKYNEVSAGQWNDNAEFATPNIMKQAQEQGYVISTSNVNQVSSFNPFEIPQGLPSVGKPVYHTKGRLGTGRVSKICLGGGI